jgi:hypothetical protein
MEGGREWERSTFNMPCRNLGQTGGMVGKMALFPLTPALSLRERENVQGVLVGFASIRCISSRGLARMRNYTMKGFCRAHLTFNAERPGKGGEN